MSSLQHKGPEKDVFDAAEPFEVKQPGIDRILEIGRQAGAAAFGFQRVFGNPKAYDT